MELESETLRRMAECFRGRTCCRCGRPAERLTAHRFYCGRHFPHERSLQCDSPVRVYHCQLSREEWEAVAAR
jgi:hypothetical protein